MQYAQVAVDAKTQLGETAFTYAIPTEFLSDIQIGSIVEVPWRNQKKLGLIMGFQKTLPKNIASKIKPIKKIILTEAILPASHLELAKWLAENYFTPLGQTIFSILPPIAKRNAKKSYLIDECQFSTSAFNKSAYYFLKAPLPQRISFYQKAIAKTLQAKRNAIIIFPDIARLDKIAKVLNLQNPIILHSQLPKTVRFQRWLEIYRGKANIVLGSRSAIFAPLREPGLIIIDQISDFSYQQESSPKYHLSQVAEKLAMFSGAKLIIGDNFLPVDYFWQTKNKTYRLLSPQVQAQPQITILDIKSQKPSYKFISFPLEIKIRQYLLAKKKILIFTNRRGAGSSFLCQDCGWLALCPNCRIPLVYYQKPLGLICHHCHHRQDVVLNCPNCHGVNFYQAGSGEQKIRQILAQLFPQNDITVSTAKIFQTDETFDLTGVIGLDNVLNLPDYHIPEEILRIINYLKEKTKEELLIQTVFPENPIFSQDFYRQEIDNRQGQFLPPFSKIIRLIFSHENFGNCQQQSEKLYKILNQHLKQPSIKISPPSPTFFPQTKRQHHLQIIIRWPRNLSTKPLENLLPQQKDWKVDVNPISLI